MLIAVGLIVNSFSGLFNAIVNAGFRLWGDTAAWDALETYYTNNDPVNLGISISYFFKEFFSFQVPDY